MTGAKYVGIGVGLVIFIFLLPTVFFVREGHSEQAVKQEKVPVWWAIKTTMKTKPFLILSSLTVVTIFGAISPWHWDLMSTSITLLRAM